MVNNNNLLTDNISLKTNNMVLLFLVNHFVKTNTKSYNSNYFCDT